MKLKTRLTFCIVLLLAAALGFTSWKNISSCRETLLESSVADSKEESEELMEEVYWSLLYPLDNPDIADLALLNYQFGRLAVKNNRTEEYVLQQEDEILYNNSGVNAHAALLQAYPELAEFEEKTNQTFSNSSDFNNSDNSEAQSELLSCTISLQQKDYCIWGRIYRIQNRNYTVALIRDITQYLAPVRQITLRCIQIGLLVTILTAISVICLLSHMLHPIKILQEKASEISKGNYHARIPIKEIKSCQIAAKNRNRSIPSSRKNHSVDELTALSLSFNEMAQAVELHMEEIKHQSEQRKMLLSALNHEMKTPVTSITGYSYVLLHSKLTEEQQKEALFYIDSECRRLERLSGKLNQLISLDFIQTESNMKKNSPQEQHIQEKFSAAALAQAAEQVLSPIAEKYGILLHTKSEKNACFLGDQDLYLMLITNLFDNARKASASIIRISLARNRIEIGDNGNGIPPDKLDKVMQPFYQGDDSRNTEGFGLGLALCERIAQIYGGTIKIESESGIGTTVTVLFPETFTTSKHPSDDSQMSSNI